MLKPLMFIGSIALLLSGCSGLVSFSSPQEKFVTAYLDGMKRGEAGLDRWCEDSSDPSSLFSVREYKLLSSSSDDVLLGEGGTWFIVQISSSTQGGMPIVKNWQIGVEKQEQNYCITDLFERRN